MALNIKLMTLGERVGWNKINMNKYLYQIELKSLSKVQLHFVICSIKFSSQKKGQSIGTHKIDLLKVIDLYWTVYVYV